MKRPKRTNIRTMALTVGGIPRQFVETKLDDFSTFGSKDLIEVKDFISRYLYDINEQCPLRNYKGICFFGSNGTGKTMLSSIILREAYLNRFTFKRVTFLEYIKYYTASWNNPHDNEVETETAIKSVDFLVLEEVGKEIDSKINSSVLEDLLRYREDHCLPTIICTNLVPEELFNRYGNSIASLIKGNTTPIKLATVDRRCST